ncbi:MAG: hypothetical protein ACL7BU_05050 [Candidatus Phlomobacter fragariae]
MLEKMKILSQQEQRYVAVIEDSLVNRVDNIRIKVKLLVNNNKDLFPILYAYIQLKPNSLMQEDFFLRRANTYFFSSIKTHCS